MIEGGEILRAVMTTGTPVRKQKYYTSVILVPANTPPGAFVTGSVQFEKNAYFMMTGVTVTAMNANIVTGATTKVDAVVGVDFSFMNNNKEMQLDYQLAVSTFSDRVNNMSDFEDYVMFEGNERVNITVTSRAATVGDRTYYITLCGIEFRE